MNILFIYSLEDVQSIKKPLRLQQQIQFGISYISSLLKKYRHNTKLIVLSKIFGERNKATIDEHIKRFYPKLICFTATSSEYDFIKEMAEYININYPDIYLLIGGCHTTLNPEDVLNGPFNALCIGEGEYPTLELVSQLGTGLSPSKIFNLWIKSDHGLEKNSTRHFLQDLDDLPFPDREMWQDWIGEQLGGGQSVLLGRGCPFECTYCCNHALREISQGSYVRFRSPKNIIEEIKVLINKFPKTKDVYLEVESFGLNKKWSIELCLELEQFNRRLDEPLSFSVNFRITPTLDLENFFIFLKKANFKLVNIGLESGSERVRHDILKRYYKNEDIIAACNLARKYNIKVSLFNMIGIPGETLEDFRETVRVNRMCLPDRHYTGIFYPYPGTRLYSLCKEWGLLKGNLKTKMERSEALLDLPGFNKRQIKKSYIWFDYNIYKGHKPIYKILLKVFVTSLRSHPFLYLTFRKIVRIPILRKLRFDLVKL